jgi:hypothetical protein
MANRVDAKEMQVEAAKRVKRTLGGMSLEQQLIVLDDVRADVADAIQAAKEQNALPVPPGKEQPS